MPSLNKKNSKNKSKKRNIAVIITLVVIAIVALVGLIGLFRQSGSSTAEVPPNFVSYPTVSSSIASSKDGKSHTIDIDLVVEFEDGTQESISHEAIYNSMTDTVSSLDYERLTRADSIEHIEQVVRERLRSVAGDDVARVYVGNIAIDFPGVVDSTQESSGSPTNNERLKGLFKNLKD